MNRILTTHVGSLIRPPALIAMLDAMDRGEAVDEGEYEDLLRSEVADIVRKQADAGIDVIDDGELGKVSWISYLFERLTGFELRAAMNEPLLPPSRDRLRFPEFYAEHDAEVAKGLRPIMFTGTRGRLARRLDADKAPAEKPLRETWVCTGPIAYDNTVLQRDIANLKAAVTDVDVAGVFMPVVAPASVIWFENEYYPSEEAIVYAIADALHDEYKAIIDAGFYLQVDDAVLAHQYDTILAEGGSVADYRHWAGLRIDALNHALRGLPEERIRYHMCWGSWHGPHAFDPPLAEIVDLVLMVNAGAYAIEQANARHEHEWQVWEDFTLPEGKKLIPGVVTHATNTVEHPELVAQRLVRLAKLVGRENVLGGTDCGFAQGAFLQRVHPTIQWAKLEALAEGARLASERLWD